MKIKKEFWELIISGEKTIELRKVNKLYKEFYLNKFYDGRINISLFKEEECMENSPFICLKDKKCNNYLGNIIINGYSIIKNPFNEINTNYYSSLKNNDYYIDKFKNEIIQLFAPYKDIDWIYKYWHWLKEYFKDEEEILILNIESWEENE